MVIDIEWRRLPAIIRIAEIGSVSSRLNAINAGINVVRKYPLGLINSDWRIQEELLQFGHPSHSHNTFVQFYLKYGPLSIVLFVELARGIAVGLGRKSPYAYALLLLFSGWAVDYAMCVTKYAFILFAIARLNESFSISGSRPWLAPKYLRQ
jgi:hypothetical protein